MFIEDFTFVNSFKWLESTRFKDDFPRRTDFSVFECVCCPQPGYNGPPEMFGVDPSSWLASIWFPQKKELRKGFFRIWVVVVVVLGGGGRWSAKSPDPGGGAV